MKIKYDMQTMKLMECFTKITHTDLKDCFIDNNNLLHFVVEQGMIGKAIGKHGKNARTLENILKRKIKILEFSSDVLQFTKNVVFPLKIKDIEALDGTITITSDDLKTRGMLIGRNATNLRNFESIIKRYNDIKELKVN